MELGKSQVIDCRQHGICNIQMQVASTPMTLDFR
jgi:hypothetical protein